MSSQPEGKGGTRMSLGYARGVSFPLAIEWCDGVWMSCETAVHWREMRDAAKAENIILIPTSGWRSFEEQKAIWLERQDPETRSAKGPAARPGWSNHQSGRSVDIKTGLTMAALRDGKTTPVYRWLRTNAKRFGFVNDVKSEAWHWTLVQTDRKARG